MGIARERGGEGRFLMGMITKKASNEPRKQCQETLQKDTRSSSTTTSTHPSNFSFPSSTTRAGSYYCCLCMSKEPQTIDISSIDINPNDPRISYVYVKTLLEKYGEVAKINFRLLSVCCTLLSFVVMFRILQKH